MGNLEDLGACLESRQLVGLLEDNKEDPTKGLTTMLATHTHISNEKVIEFDQIAEDGHHGMTPAVGKCYLPPDMPDQGFFTKEFRPASYADSWRINNCDKCPSRVPLEREYTMMDADQKLMIQRIAAMNIMNARRENRWEYDIAQLIQHSGYWVRYQDERGMETERHYVMYPRHEALNGVAVGTSWDDPNHDIICDLQQFVDIHSDIACRDVVAVFLGANVVKCLRQSKQFDLCGDNNCMSDKMRAPSFAREMVKPANDNFEGLRSFGSYENIDYYVYNWKVKGADGKLHHALDPDCVYTMALRPSQHAISRMYSRFTTLTDGPVESEVWHREFYERRPDTLEMDDRYCGMPGMLYDNVFAKWRVK